uniref:Recep_L_domain domain-containing protein n=1 Tax=Caenorhabditis tropicalis TaxID=1561998 RepID=A0A1I7V2G6_9PELO
MFFLSFLVIPVFSLLPYEPCEGFTIANNSNLSSLKDIQELFSYCLWSVYNNPKLDFEAFYNSGIANMDLNIYGNSKDIGCRQVRISPETLPYYQNCTRVTAPEWTNALVITRVDDSSDLSGLLKLDTEIGNIEVFGTGLQNLSFLRNLKTLKCVSYELQNITNIHNNPKLTRLGWDSLKDLKPNVHECTLNIQNNHPDFCLTTNELQVFAEFSIKYERLQAKLCPDLTRPDGEKVCNWGSSIPSDCQHLIGEVIIDEDNESDTWKLSNTTNIYGSLTIQNTRELLDLGFLGNLRQIATLNIGGHSLLRILSNKKLQNVTLPKMKTSPFPYSGEFIIQVDGNSMEIFENRRQCLFYQRQLKTPVKYNGFSCDKLPIAEGPGREEN